MILVFSLFPRLPNAGARIALRNGFRGVALYLLLKTGVRFALGGVAFYSRQWTEAYEQLRL